MVTRWIPPYLRNAGVKQVHQRPLVLDGFKNPLGRMDVETAWAGYPRVELPPPNEHVVIIADIDSDPDSIPSWRGGVPPILPSWIVTKHPGRKSHLGYALADPVHNNLDSLTGPLRKLADVADRLTLYLGADPDYGGRITRNPINPGPDCDAHFYQMMPWTLDALDHALPKRKRGQRERVSGIGRNVDTFAWAVKEVHRPRWHRGATDDQWLDAVLSYNTEHWGESELPFSECKSIATSAMKYARRQFSEAIFSTRQTERNGKRWHGNFDFDFDGRDASIASMHNLGFTVAEIGDIIVPHLSRSQIYRRIQRVASHNS